MNQIKIDFNKNKIIKKVNELFITYRRKFLTQYEADDGEVTFVTSKFTLVDRTVAHHLDGSKTIGVLLGLGGLTKFFTFDVDIKDNPLECREVTRRLVNHLIDHYGILRKDIHVSFSGNKGYHVDLYFDTVYSSQMMLPFYLEVLSELNETKKRIERRPTSTLGVKLPLGYHLETGEYCTYVDNLTFEPLGIQYFLNIEPMSWEEFYNDILIECTINATYTVPTSTTPRKFEKESPKISVDFHKEGMQREEVEEILSEGHLLCSGTRNNFTLYASMFLKENGAAEKETYKKIIQVLENTLNNPQTRNFISMVNLKALKKETARVVGMVFTHDYKVSENSHATKVEIYSNELKAMLSINNPILSRLLFVLLIHSKRFSNRNGTFYCTYRQLGKQGVGKNGSRTLVKLKALQELGAIEIVSENGKYSFKKKCKPANVYRMRLPKGQGKDFITVECTGILSVENIVDNFVTLSHQEKENLMTLGLKYNFDLIE